MVVAGDALGRVHFLRLEGANESSGLALETRGSNVESGDTICGSGTGLRLWLHILKVYRSLRHRLLTHR